MTYPSPPTDNVVDFQSRRHHKAKHAARIIRLSPENDGLCMLYSNSASQEKLYSMSILCWGLRDNGEVVGMVPWLNSITPCNELHDPLNGHWEGYYDPEIDDVFYTPPEHKRLELQSAAHYFDCEHACENTVMQEIPDTIGTHALLATDDFRSLTLTEVVSWRLYGDGHISAMLITPEKVTTTPVLPGDDCLYPADSHLEFKYFFQHHIANQIKAEDPVALAAVALLIEH